MTTSIPSTGVTVTAKRPTSAQTFNINNFRTQLDSIGGIAKTSLFRVEIPIPPNIRHRSKITTEKLTFLVASVNFPGVKITSIPIQRYGMGPLEDMPTGFAFTGCEMNIIGDSEGNVLKFFRDWTRGIVEYQSVTDGSENPSVPNMKPYHLNYKKNYETQITIVLYDMLGNRTYRMSLIKAFPIDLMNTYLAWSNFDQVMYIPIRFQFVDVAFSPQGDEITAGQGATASYQGLSLLEIIGSAGASIQTISDAFRTPHNLGDVINSVNNTVAGIKQLGNIFGGL